MYASLYTVITKLPMKSYSLILDTVGQQRKAKNPKLFVNRLETLENYGLFANKVM